MEMRSGHGALLAAVGGACLLGVGYVAFGEHTKRRRVHKQLQDAFVVWDSESDESETGDDGEVVFVRGSAGVPSGDALVCAPFSGVPCLCYRATKKRVTEDKITSSRKAKSGRGGERKVGTESYRSSESVLEESKDQVKRLVVHVAGGRQLSVDISRSILTEEWFVELEHSVDRFEEPRGGGSQRTVGFRLEERILREGTSLCVFGRLRDGVIGGALSLPLLVGTQEPDAFVHAHAATTTMTLVASAASTALGVTLIVAALLSR